MVVTSINTASMVITVLPVANMWVGSKNKRLPHSRSSLCFLSSEQRDLSRGCIKNFYVPVHFSRLKA